MPMNTNPYSPRVRADFAMDADLAPQTLWGVDILSAGQLDVTDIDGNEVSYTFTEFDPAQAGPYTQFPYRLRLQIKTVHASSTVPDADIIPLI